MKSNLSIPVLLPRSYQIPLFKALDNGIKRAVLQWHRRGGKDTACLSYLSKAALTEKGNYWYMLPEKEQARKVIWNGINPHTGKRIIDEIFPRCIVLRANNQQMLIELINGSIIQFLGSDSYDSHVGGSPRGIIFSEYALSNPSSWNYMRPMLLENGGWSIFNSTVRGKNHFYQLSEFAKNDKLWFFSRVNADESGVFTKDQLDQELKEYIGQNGEEEGRAMFMQEYFNDPNAAIPGAYYGKWMSDAHNENRICNLPYDASLPVITAWDLGTNDLNCIWFIQVCGKNFHVIDYYYNNDNSLAHYVKVIKDKPYAYDRHLLPHDANNKTVQTNMTSYEILSQLGLRNLDIVKRTKSLAIQIEAVRVMLPKCYFDDVKTKDGRNSLVSYHREWDDKNKVFRDHPKHDWASHGASAFATFAQGYEDANSYNNLLKCANVEYNMW